MFSLQIPVRYELAVQTGSWRRAFEPGGEQVASFRILYFYCIQNKELTRMNIHKGDSREKLNDQSMLGL